MTPRPAVLPLPVLEEAQRDLVGLPGIGMSVMEISHRSKAFDEIIQGAEADMRTLGGIPDDYKVMFLDTVTAVMTKDRFFDWTRSAISASASSIGRPSCASVSTRLNSSLIGG